MNTLLKLQQNLESDKFIQKLVADQIERIKTHLIEGLDFVWCLEEHA